MRVLIADDFEDMRELLQFVVCTEMGLEATLVESGRSAIQQLQKDPEFDLILSDMHMPDGTGLELFQHCQKVGLRMPFVMLSGDRLDQHPQLKSAPIHWIAKPFDISDVVKRIGNILSVQTPSDAYLPVSLTLLRRMQNVEIPLYVRINDHKYVKLTGGPSIFNDDEHQKYFDRGLRYLYIESVSADQFIAAYRKKVLSLGAWADASNDDHEGISLNIELLKNMSKLLGWDQRMVELARQSIQKALHVVKFNPSLHTVMNQFHKIERYGFADHCTVTMMVSAGLLKIMGYNDEMSLAKITFASVLHDISLTDQQYEHKRKIIKKLLKGERSSHDSQVIFEHPAKAAELCRGWDFCPPDVDLIVMNHHERPDGSGFPFNRSAADLDFMSALFIVSEDLSDFFIEFFGKPDLKSYIENRRPIFNRGHFKSIFRTLEATIEQQSQQAS